mmetsp:Transcript_132605/g.369692  ORF Transcript_132605/g.369692 Transcript_132605/m.369692 type:complete len:222 (-) Transcript_132605:1245-1910(-)
MRQMETAVFAEVAAVSQALTAVMVSSKGSSSTPMRKGPSASAALETASCTDCSFSAASFNNNSHVTRSAPSRCAALSWANRASAALARFSSLPTSATAMPIACAFRCSMSFEHMDTWSDAFFTACSACCRTSLFSPAPLSMAVASSALSQSTSAGLSCARMSSTIFLVACRWRKSCRTVFNGLSLFCASCSCCCNLLSSAAACCLILSLSKRLALACLAFR